MGSPYSTVKSIIATQPAIGTQLIPLPARAVIVGVQLSLGVVNAAATPDGICTASVKFGAVGSSADTGEVLAIVNVGFSVIGGGVNNSVFTTMNRQVAVGEQIILALAGTVPTQALAYGLIFFVPS